MQTCVTTLKCQQTNGLKLPLTVETTGCEQPDLDSAKELHLLMEELQLIRLPSGLAITTDCLAISRRRHRAMRQDPLECRGAII